MSKKVIDDTPVVMDDLEDILMEDLDDILKKEQPTGNVPPCRKTEEETPEATPAVIPEVTSEELSEEPAEEERPRVPVFMPKLSDLQGKEDTKESTAPGTESAEPVTDAAESPKPENEGRILGLYETEEKKKDGDDKKPGKKGFWKKCLIICAIVLGVAAVGAYGYGVYYYSNHFLPATVVDGVSLDNLTLEEAQAHLTASKKAEDSVLTLTALDGTAVTMDTSAMDITRSYLGLPEALSVQEKWTFPVSKDPVKDLGLGYEITYDKAAAEECLKALEICDPEKTVHPADAYVTRDNKGTWVVVPAVDGNTVDTSVLADAVVKAIDGKQKELNIKDNGAYLTAEVYETSPMLIRKAEVENKIDELEFTVDMGADTIHTITADDYRGLLKEGVEYEENPETILDQEKFDKFMEKLSRSYSTKSASGHRYFKSITGNRIAMQSSYGWDMDKEATAEIVGTMLVQAGKKILVDEEIHETYPLHQVTAVWKQTAVSHGERDTGESWVEVNLTQQKMYCIIDGEIKLESNCVSGTEMVKERRTPEGFFAIRFKSTDRDLVGYNPDGTESYRSHVNYWMPVYNNIGLHDATWRGAFGGNIYKWNGSHGCVNLPLKAAKELYGYVEKGMSVIFYRENKTYTTN